MEKAFEQPKKQENSLEKREGEKFVDYLKRRIKESEYPIDIEQLLHCHKCGKRIKDASTEFFTTPRGMPFDSVQCAVESASEGGHSDACTCMFCGSNEELEKIFQEVLPNFEKIHGTTGNLYALREAKKRLREQRILEYTEKQNN